MAAIEGSALIAAFVITIISMLLRAQVALRGRARDFFEAD
jgi:uncharacterized membrane protein YvlD (DUF360 family)